MPVDSQGRWDPLRHYMREAVVASLLTREEECALAVKVQAGDEVARERMILSNLRLVIKIAKDFEGCGLPMLDIINLGNIGLMKAVGRFDPDKGARFSTYSSWWIKQSILRGLSNQSRTIRVPAHAMREIAHLKRMKDDLEMALGREATPGELAEEAEVPEHRIRRLFATAVGTVPLDAPLSADSNDSLGTTVADDESKSPSVEAERNDLKGRVAQVFSKLPKREREILSRRFGLDGREPETLESIGGDFGVTRERIRQLEAIALRKLRIMASGECNPVAA
jgi:RNA polymerase primary sigma factor